MQQIWYSIFVVMYKVWAMEQRSRPFFGRQRELALLRELWDERIATLAVIKGRRRIGKSRLIEEFVAGKPHITVTGLAPEEKVTAQHQRDAFALQLESQLQRSEWRTDDWHHLFFDLIQAVPQDKVVLVFDEINWMGSKDPTFLPKLKTAWDLYFSKHPKLLLVLSGSMSAWIDNNILGSTAFFGRITSQMTLDELPLPICAKFWGGQQQHLAGFELFKVLSVLGGIPRYLELIRPHLSAEENIARLCFTREGLLFNEFDSIFSDLFARRAGTYKKIVETLTHGVGDQEAILHQLGHSAPSGAISDYLEELVETGYLARDYTWHLKTGKLSKLSHYRLRDNYLRFYLRYIEPHAEVIKRVGSLQLPQWTSIMGLQFENLVLNHRQQLYSLIGISSQALVFDNPFFLRATKERKGCQIDLLIQTHFNTLYLCEIKFSKSAIGTHVIGEVQEKIRNMHLPRGFSVRPVLIHVNGVTDGVEESGFFAHLIDFNALLKE